MHTRKNWLTVQQDIARLFETWMAFRRNGNFVQNITLLNLMQLKLNEMQMPERHSLKHHWLQSKDMLRLCNHQPFFLPGQIGLTWTGTPQFHMGSAQVGCIRHHLEIIASFSHFGTNGQHSPFPEPPCAIIGPLPFSFLCKQKATCLRSCTGVPI